MLPVETGQTYWIESSPVFLCLNVRKKRRHNRLNIVLAIISYVPVIIVIVDVVIIVV